MGVSIGLIGVDKYWQWKREPHRTVVVHREVVVGGDPSAKGLCGILDQLFAAGIEKFIVESDHCRANGSVLIRLVEFHIKLQATIGHIKWMKSNWWC